MPDSRPLSDHMGMTEPKVAFFPNRLGDEPFLFIDGHQIGMTDWVRSVEARLRALSPTSDEQGQAR